MKSMISRLQEDLEEVEASGHIDPFMLAAKVCDRFVNIHPLQNICRLHKKAAKSVGIRANLGPWSLKRRVAPSRRCLER